MKQTLEYLINHFREAPSTGERIAILDSFPKVRDYLLQSPVIREYLENLPPESEVAAKQLIAIGQMDRIVGEGPVDLKNLLNLLEKMTAVDNFYRELGGIVGYQKKILEFLETSPQMNSSEISGFHAPDFIDIREESSEVWEAVLRGIQAMPLVAEMYPLGGAADRLHLVDEGTGLELPAARLEYGGRTLFEVLIRDLQAREYLYYKLYGIQVEVPVAIMTSEEKDNHRHVENICTEFKWFGRRKELFRFFTQPLVPAVDSAGNWHLAGPLALVLKPGGHGALWKLAKDAGIFRWLKGLDRRKAIIRQINNPVAGLDYGLLAFTGFGMKTNAYFGFASCSRLLQSAEGVNVILEKKNGEIALTNIEYCDFAKFGIEDRPMREGDIYSRFSSNTNILFADLKAIEDAVKICPFPGLLINLKPAAVTLLSGEKKEACIGRLESTMQNIADVFVGRMDRPSGPIEDGNDELEKSDAKSSKGRSVRSPKGTFVTYNHRNKTIATAKKAYRTGGPIRETPEECFYVQLQAARQLLSERCSFDIPLERTLLEYLEQGPEFIFLYHPSLGPLYSIISQKLFGGRIMPGSELQLEIAEACLNNLDIHGSLLIHSLQPMGHFDEKGILNFSNRSGRCLLKNVSIKNEGVDWQKSRPYWKNRFVRKEAMEIRLQGFSEFVAENVHFEGSYQFDVPEGVRMRVSQGALGLEIQTEILSEAQFSFYQWDVEKGVKVSWRK